MIKEFYNMMKSLKMDIEFIKKQNKNLRSCGFQTVRILKP